MKKVFWYEWYRILAVCNVANFATVELALLDQVSKRKIHVLRSTIIFVNTYRELGRKILTIYITSAPLVLVSKRKLYVFRSTIIFVNTYGVRGHKIFTIFTTLSFSSGFKWNFVFTFSTIERKYHFWKYVLTFSDRSTGIFILCLKANFICRKMSWQKVLYH